MNTDENFYKMEENTRNNTCRIEKSMFKDILISPNNDDIIIPVSSTFDKAVLHIGIGKVHGISIEKIGLKVDEKLKTSVKYATRRFSDDYYSRSKKGRNITESTSEDKIKNVIEGGKHCMRDVPSLKKINGQMTKLRDPLSCKATAKSMNSITKKSDTSTLKQMRSENLTADINSLGYSTEKTFFTTTFKCDSVQKQVPSHGFDSKTPAEPDKKNERRMLFEKRLEAQRSIPIKAIVGAYENEMLENATDKELGLQQENDIRSITETQLGSPPADDIHIYLDEIFVVPKRGFQRFAECISDSQESKGKDIELNNVISHSDQFSDVVHIDKNYIVPNSETVDKERNTPIFDAYVDTEAVDEHIDSDKLVDTLDIESNNEIVDIEAISFKDQDEVCLTEVRNGTNETSINGNMCDSYDDIFGILEIYINSDLHLDYSKIPVSKQCDQKKDFGYKFFSFSSFFK